MWAGILFGAALFTDYFDGMIARRTKTITRLGRIMDPLADKLLVLSAVLMLISLHRVNVLIAILLLGREIAVTGLRTLASSEGIMIPSIMTGKVKTWFEGFAIGFLLAGPDCHLLGLNWMWMGTVLIYGALGLALWSGAIYFRDYYRGSLDQSKF